MMKGQTSNNLPFVGKKYFEDVAYSTTYVVTIKSNGATTVESGGRGIDNKGQAIYKGKYKPLMQNKSEGIKIENGFLYLLNEKGIVRKDCINEDIECPCKFNVKSETLTK
jgi:hypothetical protein